MTPLFAIVLSAIVTLGGPRVDAETAERYATDIVVVAGDDVELAIGLVATGDEEGLHWSPRIERCECKAHECDRDASTGLARAYGLFQLHKYWWSGHTSQEICASNRLSTELAAKALVFLRKTHGGSIRAALRWFNGAPKEDPRIVRRLKVYERWIANFRKAA